MLGDGLQLQLKMKVTKGIKVFPASLSVRFELETVFRSLVYGRSLGNQT